MAAGAAVSEGRSVPGFAGFIEDDEFVVAILLQLAAMVATTQCEFSCRFLVRSNGGAVCILLPPGANVISVAEKTLIAIDEFGNWFAGVRLRSKARRN